MLPLSYVLVVLVYISTLQKYYFYSLLKVVSVLKFVQRDSWLIRSERITAV